MDDNDTDSSTGNEGASDYDTSSSPLTNRRATCGRGATHSRGATRDQGVTCRRGSIHGCGATRGRGATSRTNALGEWKKQETSVLCYNYSLTPGAKVQFRNYTSASNLFCLFFTNEVWDLLTTETNRYANTNLPQQEHARPWNNISVSEMKALLAY